MGVTALLSVDHEGIPLWPQARTKHEQDRAWFHELELRVPETAQKAQQQLGIEMIMAGIPNEVAQLLVSRMLTIAATEQAESARASIAIAAHDTEETHGA